MVSLYTASLVALALFAPVDAFPGSAWRSVWRGHKSTPPAYCPSAHDCNSGHNETLLVKTTSGPLLPLIDEGYPDVIQYLSVPFAAPPLGELRFSPPQKIKPSTQTIKADKLPPACMQNAGSPNIFDVYEPGYHFDGEQSEDCLKLNVYKPSKATDQRLPVLIFVYGGAWQIGGSNETYEIPTPWVQAKQDLIVVSIQYRLNIFGYPNSAALAENNVGLQDIRFSVEWIRDNIAAFGGDPERMVLWGQSAGSISTNAYTFTNLDDQIVKGTISTSGAALTPTWQSKDVSQSNFTFVAENLGCSGTELQQLACMRQKPAAALRDYLVQYNGTASLKFNPVVDDTLVFQNYTERIVQNQVSKQPAIVGSNRREGERVIDKGLSPNGPNQTEAAEVTTIAFLCPSELTAKLRHDIGAPTYRYEYKGNFSNISPLPWMGAYHASPLPLLFGTHNITAAHPLSGASTPFEYAVSSHMQDLWRAFVNNPSSLVALDWPLNEGGAVNETTNAIKLLPGKGHTLSSVEYAAPMEQHCPLIDRYLISQTLPAGFDTTDSVIG